MSKKEFKYKGIQQYEEEIKKLKEENRELKELLQTALDDNILSTFLIETVKKYGIEYSEVHPINVTDKKQ